MVVVALFYNEGAQVSAFIGRVSAALDKTDADWSIVCINDGSADDTLAQLMAARQREPRVKVIDFSRNFGKEYALTAGLDYAAADAVVLIDSDLQHPPEMLPAMIAKWREGAEVVYMVREERVDTGLFNRVGRRAFYLIFRIAADIKLPSQAGDFRLLDAAVVAAIRRLPERTRFMKGIFQWVGFRQVGLAYHEEARGSGATKSHPLRLMAFAFDGISAFSNLPLQLWGLLGAVIAGVISCTEPRASSEPTSTASTCRASSHSSSRSRSSAAFSSCLWGCWRLRRPDLQRSEGAAALHRATHVRPRRTGRVSLGGDDWGIRSAPTTTEWLLE